MVLARVDALLSANGDHDCALPATDIAFEVEDLLPGSEHRLSFVNGDGERGPKQSGLQMRVAVAVMPGLLVAIAAAGRDELEKNFRQIALQARFEFDCSDGGRAANVENVDRSRANAGFGDDGRDAISNVMHVAVAGGVDGELVLVDHRLFVSGGDDARVLDHEDHGSLRSTGAVEHALGNNKTLTGREFDRSAFQINEQLAFDDVKEFVIIVMLVPVILAFDDSKTDDGIVYLAERLVVPIVRSRISDGLFVDEFQVFMKDVKARVIGICGSGHGSLLKAVESDDGRSESIRKTYSRCFSGQDRRGHLSPIVMTGTIP